MTFIRLKPHHPLAKTLPEWVPVTSAGVHYQETDVEQLAIGGIKPVCLEAFTLDVDRVPPDQFDRLNDFRDMTFLASDVDSIWSETL